MEAQLVDELPTGGGWQYEPKWDGFRGVVENDGGELAVWSRNGRPLLRYFPELRSLGDALPPHSALDGEIVIARDGMLDFDAMQLRLHPAESRIQKLSAEMPAQFIAFDLLLWDGEAVHERPLEERRAALEARAGNFRLSPTESDAEAAREWLGRLEAAGLDGVIAKRLGLPYLPGSRDGVVKVKPHRTTDCVIVGFRWSDKVEGQISTLLLGVYRDDGALDFVGHTSGFPAAIRKQLHELLPPLVETTGGTSGFPQTPSPGSHSRTGGSAAGHISGERVPGGQSRWSRGKELDWVAVRPELVCEIRYDKLERNRFRHGTKFVRFRPDKDPDQCTWREVRPPRRADDPTVDDLLTRVD